MTRQACAGLVERLEHFIRKEARKRKCGIDRRARVTLGADEFVALRPVRIFRIKAHLAAIEYRQRVHNAQRAANMAKAARLHLLQHADADFKRETLQPLF
ncbi:hypothetical protein SDC9_131276 [bioreactor metagenome]|uniref:Uncharacterized protein n=1 Tax=bioreactor metagenome TaxID=1076179 RepID=A0A645D4S1_9ZZZZ